MRAKMNGAAGQRLRDAKREFQRWRQECRRPGRIPSELWLLAAEAAAEHGIEPTASQLQLSAERLEQWVEQLGLIRGRLESPGTEFVELPPMPWGGPGECQLEVEDPTGRKLRISLKGSAVAQLPTVLPTLLAKELVS
jgi:hypothetical protein